MKKKKKKEEVKYVDDGRTIADMSNVGNGGLFLPMGRGSKSSFKDQWNTYWNAVKMMLVPMLVVIGFIYIAFLVVYLAMLGL